MPTLPPKSPIDLTQFYGSREIRLQNSGNSHFTQLMHLCTDFGFCVLQLQRKNYNPGTTSAPLAPEFVLALRAPESLQWFSVTPPQISLRALNEYALAHQVDILHDHLFGAEGDKLNQPLADC